MTTIETIRKQVEIWEAFKGLPDDSVVRADLAAIFLGISKKTLAKLRQEGDGPPYIQISAEGSTARNQLVNYVLGKLRVYRASKEVDSSIHAAKVRGLTFSSLNDLLEEQPFWQRTTVSMVKGGMGRGMVEKERTTIVGHVQTVSDSDFESLLHEPKAEVIWLSLADAMDRELSLSEARQPFHRAYIKVLEGMIEGSNRQQEVADLHQ